MYSIAVLTVFVFFYAKLCKNPDGGVARFLRKVLPVALIVIAAYFFVEKWQYNYSPTLEKLNSLMAISLMQGYAALWFVHVLTSVTWILSPQNTSAWIVMPWEKGSSKLMGLFWNGFLCLGIIPVILVQVAVVGILVLGYRKLRVK